MTKPTFDSVVIGGGFFGYAKEIVRLLESRGRKAVAFEDRPALDSWTKAAIRLAPALVSAKAEAYFDRILDQIRHHPVRDVLVIKGESFSPAAIQRFRSALPNARFTLYFWDSYRNLPKDSGAKVDWFDKVFTFDPVDARTDQRLTYRPLFYLQEYAELPRITQDIDLLFLGTVHSDRYAVLKRLQQSLPAHVRFERVMYVASRAIYSFRRIADPAFWPARQNEFVFNPVSKHQILSLVARSRVVVDIERTVQTGLTMRTIEAFGAGKKIITTNRMIMSSDIFHPANVAVIDRVHPELPPDFLQTPVVEPSAELRYRYSLAGWLDEVLGVS